MIDQTPALGNDVPRPICAGRTDTQPVTLAAVSAAQMGYGSEMSGVGNSHPLTLESPSPDERINHRPTSDLQRISIPAGGGTRDKVRTGWLSSTNAETTQRTYEYVIAEFFRWCDRNGVDPLDPKRVGVDTYRQRLLRRHQKSTVAKKLSALSSFYAYGLLEHSDLVPDNPVTRVVRPRVSQESTRAGLDAEETLRLLAAASLAGRKDAAVVHLLIWCGLRVAELRSARVADLATERGERTLTVTRKGGKRQPVVVPEPAAQALDGYLVDRTEGRLVLGCRGIAVSRYEVALMVSRAVVAAGVTGKRVTPHSMRHTFATLTLDAGSDIREVQRALGHAHLDTTMRYDRSRSRVDRSPGLALARLLDEGAS